VVEMKVRLLTQVRKVRVIKATVAEMLRELERERQAQAD